MHIHRSMYLLRGLVLCLALLCLFPSVFAQTLTRDWEPVVVVVSGDPDTGAFQNFIGASTDRIHLYRYSGVGDGFTPIPFQIDRKQFWDLRDNCPPVLDLECVVLKLPPGSESLHNCEWTYAFDSNGDPSPGVLNQYDEVVFLARDAGPKSPNTVVWKDGLVSSRRYEITVHQRDELGEIVGQGWVYAFLFDSPHPFELPYPHYVRWTVNPAPDPDRPTETCVNADSNPVRGAKACGTFEQGPEFAASFPSRASLHQRYIGNWINNRIRVVPPGSSTPGPDLTDRVKFRATAETEWLWSNCVCPRFLGLKIGPVRAIRLVQGAASGYMTTRTDYFYPTHAGTVIRLRVHPGVSNIEHFTDYVSSVSGAKLYTKTGGTATAQAIIDGSPGNDPGNAAWLDWTQANTAGGRLVWFFREPRPINAGVPEYTLLDSSTVTKDPEFQPGAYGNHGEKWPGPTSNLEDPACFMNPDHPNLLYAESHALVFAFPAGGSESAQEAADLQAQFENLLSHTVVAEDRNFPPPSPPPPSCPVFVNETNPNNGRYLDAAPTTGPPSTPCSDSTAAFSVERAIGSGDFVKVGEIPKNGTFRDFEIYRGATYRYRVRGRNALGVEGPVSPIVTMTANDAEPPSVPVGVAMVGTEQSVTLSWDPSPSRDIRGFHVYLSTLPGGPYTRANATLIAASKLSFKASVPANGITYYGVIRAEDWASNLSPESEEVSAIPIP